MTFKKYQSHKIVDAAKIVSFVKRHLNPHGEKEEFECLLTAEDGTLYTEKETLFARGEPQDDYFYLVKYDDGYTSWSPKDALENGYSEIQEPNLAVKNFDFGIAICHLKKGRKVARKGWNGKSMYLALQEGSVIDKENARSGAAKAIAEEGKDKITILPHIDMRSVQGEVVVGWLASQTDMLSEDWMIVE